MKKIHVKETGSVIIYEGRKERIKEKLARKRN